MEAQDWVTVAVLGRTRGNRGEITAMSLSGGVERFRELGEVYVGETELRIEDAWEHDGRLILKFQGIDSIAAAEELQGAEVRIARQRRAALPEGEFYQSDLVGCEVFDPQGGRLGEVAAWREGGGSGLLELDNGLLIPFARAICVEIDPAARRIVARLPQGLRELNQRS